MHGPNQDDKAKKLSEEEEQNYEIPISIKRFLKKLSKLDI